MNEETKNRIAAINSGIIPEDYKKTKVGIVPVEWEVEQIGKYLVEYKEKSTENNQYPVLTSSRKGLMLQTDYFKDRQVTTENNTGYNIIPYGYLTFRSRTDDGRFVFNKNTIIDKGIISYFYPVFSFKKKVDTTFMLELLNFSIYHRFMPFVEGTAQQVLSLKKLGNLIYAIPPLPEQQKIAEILSTQDKLIELQEKKIEQLKELKKAYLQKMFPKKGSKYPELRFKGFTAPWEQRVFGDLAEYKKGPFGSAITKDMFVPKSDLSVKVYEQQNAINKDWTLERYFLPKEYVITKLKSFEVHGGDIIVSCAGTIGEIYEIPINAECGIINQALMRVQVNEDVVGKKLFTIVFSNMIEAFSSIHSNGSAIKNIPPFADLKPMKVLIPSIEEQKKIENYFCNLDTLITLHQRKSEQEKQKKKALMQLLLTGKVRCI